MAETLIGEGFVPVPAARTQDEPKRASSLSETASHAPSATTRTLAVENLHCGGCMRKVEAALTALPEVEAARVNLSARRVAVVMRETGDTSQTDAVASTLAADERIISALADAGFKAAPVAANSDQASAAAKAERALLIRLAVAGFAAANVMLLSVSVWSGDASGDMAPAMETLFHWLTAMIALPTVAFCGQPFFSSAVSALSARRLNMDVPISLGVLLATGMSLFQAVVGHGHVYFDAAVMLLFFLLIGRFLDTRMRTRAAGAASNLLALRALAADVISDDGSIRRLPAEALAPGMRVQITPGARIAVDGTVVSGTSDIDNGLITGESTPEAVSAGARVYAGAMNLSGALVVRADAVEDETLLSDIARLMATAEQARGNFVRLADRAAQIYAPAVHLLGLATFLGWLSLGSGWEFALTTAIAVLIITCPCALALAVPAVQVAATGRLFDRGVLVKAADGLERLSECDVVVFDKTGTLTTGAVDLATLTPTADAHLATVASIAATSRHPHARAIVAAAEARGLSVRPMPDVEELAGQGLIATDEAGATHRLGSARFCGVTVEAREATDEPEVDAAADVALWYVSPGGAAVPYPVRDRLRPDAADTVTRLQAAGLAVEVLSGDRASAVDHAAAAIGVAPEDVRARTTPSDKVARLDALRAAGHKVLMVGDGLNDAPSLASAHASISPSDAADISQTAADVVFQGESLAPIVETLAVARQSQRMAIQNFGIALCYNAVFVPLAVAGFVTPLLAAIAMSASSIAVTANAIRLRTRGLNLR